MLSLCSSRYYLLRLCDTLTAGQPGGRNSCKRKEKRGCKADGRVGAGGGREGGDRRNSKNKAERLQRDRSGHSRSACGRSSQPGASATLCFWRGAREHCGPGRGKKRTNRQSRSVHELMVGEKGTSSCQSSRRNEDGEEDVGAIKKK